MIPKQLVVMHFHKRCTFELFDYYVSQGEKNDPRYSELSDSNDFTYYLGVELLDFQKNHYIIGLALHSGIYGFSCSGEFQGRLYVFLDGAVAIDENDFVEVTGVVKKNEVKHEHS